jgi:hypothetical protein
MLAYLIKSYTADPVDTSTVAAATAYPSTSTRRYLLELCAMKLAERLPSGPGRADRWQLSHLAAELLDDADFHPLCTESPTGSTYLSSNVGGE